MDLLKFQWVGMLEMDKKSVPCYAIFDYDASADVHKEWELDLPLEGRYVYVGMTDKIRNRRLRKLLETK